jgi:hypothetical protein
MGRNASAFGTRKRDKMGEFMAKSGIDVFRIEVF